ncbi:MAG TPA: bifunctional DNA-formamidopyrimidine glycosylase/DNA-(apurinic or apyrimidinic site) lyase [Phycisphaerales bacterium]|nr:bifunctional DNA-formamidopyrimidine glycosylase/DNA-(apurinic or apyrimidinic site) lyase [Phycisphaerales bacterium]
MPELPEVETVRRSLAPHLVGRTIDTARLRRRDFVSGKATPAALLQGATIERLERRGKQLAVIARDGRVVIVQLGMSGQVLVSPADAPLPTHVHAVWTLRGSKQTILFRDPRRFGGLTTLDSTEDLQRAWSALGPDGLAVTGGEFWKAVNASARAIKSALLDQRTVAGVGNIYADEALFEAGVHPKAICRRLSRPRIERLARAIREVLARAVEARGSTLRDYRDADGLEGSYAGLHRVYGRGGLPCPSCGKPLQKLTVGQRTTVCCPRCQTRS